MKSHIFTRNKTQTRDAGSIHVYGVVNPDMIMGLPLTGEEEAVARSLMFSRIKFGRFRFDCFTSDAGGPEASRDLATGGRYFGRSPITW